MFNYEPNDLPNFLDKIDQDIMWYRDITVVLRDLIKMTIPDKYCVLITGNKLLEYVQPIYNAKFALIAFSTEFEVLTYTNLGKFGRVMGFSVIRNGVRILGSVEIYEDDTINFYLNSTRECLQMLLDAFLYIYRNLNSENQRYQLERIDLENTPGENGEIENNVKLTYKVRHLPLEIGDLHVHSSVCYRVVCPMGDIIRYVSDYVETQNELLLA